MVHQGGLKSQFPVFSAGMMITITPTDKPTAEAGELV